MGKLEKLSERFPALDVKAGMNYCANDEAFYFEMFDEYCHCGRNQRLAQYFTEEKWEEYGVEVHALKSGSRYLGFVQLGDLAERLEKAAKGGDVDYVKENHAKAYNQLCEIIQFIDNEL